MVAFERCMEMLFKIRRMGIGGLFRAIAARLRLRQRTLLYCNLMKLLLAPSSQRKRILGIWDYKALPWSVGDPLVFIEMLSILKIQHNAEEIDICVVYDRENPAGNRGRSGNHNLASENAQDWILELLPLFSTCPYLGSVHQFNTRSEFHRFLKSNSDRYDVFPSLSEHLAETYNYEGGAPNIKDIEEFYGTSGYIPHLRIGDRERSWALWFYQHHLPETSVPVTLSLRQIWGDPERNANPQVWLSFIDKCRQDFPEVSLVVVGLREEVFDGLRDRSNVIIAKDFGTSIIEDLALIRASLMYMGTTSGVNAIALFSDLPYLLFQEPVPTLEKYGLEPGMNYSFATDRQKLFSTATLVTPKLLSDEFAALYSELDREQWRIIALEKARYKHTHPSGKVIGT